jgi:hypothetical protein
MRGKLAVVLLGLAAAGVIGWLALGKGPTGAAIGPALERAEALAEEGGLEPARVEESHRSAAGGEGAKEQAASHAEFCALLVRDEAGLPVKGAEVLLAGAEDPPLRVMTGSDGRARFEPAEEARLSVARAPGLLPGGLAVPAGTGEHALTLLAGHSLEGRLLEDGAPPASPIRLSLRSNRGPFDGLPEELGALARQHFELPRMAEIFTDTLGGFRFEGLAPDWSGELWLPSTHWFLEAPEDAALGASNDKTLLLPAPRKGLVLATTRLATLRGRVVWADGTGPVAHGALHLRADFAGGQDSPYTGSRTDATGRFEVGLGPSTSADRALWKQLERRPALTSVVLWLQPDGGLERELAFAAEELGPDGDLGELSVERGRSLHFVVRQPDGAPVGGAIVSASSLSEPTDADGRGQLHGLAGDVAEVLVGGPHHRVLRLPLGPGGASAQTPLVFVLPRGNELRLSLTDEHGHPPAGVQLGLASQTPVFEGTTGFGPSSLHYRLLGKGFESAEWGPEGGVLKLRLDPQGKASLCGLRDGLRLAARVLDRLDRVVVEDHFDGPAGGELLARAIVVRGAAFELAGRVVDELRTPLPNVEVRLGGANKGLVATTGSDGRFAFDGLRESDEGCTLEARLRGHATRRLEEVLLRAGPVLPDLVLERGRSLRVRVVDASGAPLSVHLVCAEAPGGAQVCSRELEPGCELLEDLPPGRVKLYTQYGWRAYEQLSEPGDREVRFELPLHGSLELLAPQTAPPGADRELRARVTALDDSTVTGVLLFNAESGGRTERLALLPGSYQVELQDRGRSADGSPEERHLWSGQVEVLAGRNAAIQL